jgi:hypothetical protein
MSSVRKTITFDSFIFDTYVIDYGNNLSKYIQKLVILGAGAMVEGIEHKDRRILVLMKELEEIKVENLRLKQKLGSDISQEEKTYFQILNKYKIEGDVLKFLEKCKDIIKKDQSYFDANFKMFKNLYGIELSKLEFKILIKGDD